MNKIIINAPDEDQPIVYRAIFKHTPEDIEIHSQTIPKKPFWLFCVVKSIRFYQKYLSERLGNRCVYNPSCSRYSEMAFRKKGFYKGLILTIDRLKRCQPQNGGNDFL
ncbi:membrane protein insertion efficiency factor YidD [Flammeovirga sp. OC4]|uniref:membrane protein insertion efficiency factor YidD n=1 Tax=Flammeovirga sp. OC4 TaxID=1382345 RepID=UPI0009E2A08A|nr:membrane protein insertion efficiency factor YidD [Flammeovirga sp. OC4]